MSKKKQSQRSAQKPAANTSHVAKAIELPDDLARHLKPGGDLTGDMNAARVVALMLKANVTIASQVFDATAVPRAIARMKDRTIQGLRDAFASGRLTCLRTAPVIVTPPTSELSQVINSATFVQLTDEAAAAWKAGKSDLLAELKWPGTIEGPPPEADKTKRSEPAAPKPEQKKFDLRSRLNPEELAALLATGKVFRSETVHDRPYSLVLYDAEGTEVGCCPEDTVSIELIRAAMSQQHEDGKAQAATILAAAKKPESNWLSDGALMMKVYDGSLHHASLVYRHNGPTTYSLSDEDGKSLGECDATDDNRRTIEEHLAKLQKKRRTVYHAFRGGSVCAETFQIGKGGVKKVWDTNIDKGFLRVVYDNGSEREFTQHQIVKEVLVETPAIQEPETGVQSAEPPKWPDPKRNLIAEHELLRSGRGFALEVVWDAGRVHEVVRADRIYPGPCTGDSDAFIQVIQGVPVVGFSAAEMVVLPYYSALQP